MKEPSAKRKRTLALHERALRFSAGVNACCPQRFSNPALIKLRLGHLDHFQCTAEQELESEASQLAAIFATIILNMRLRLEQGRANRKARKS